MYAHIHLLSCESRQAGPYVTKVIKERLLYLACAHPVCAALGCAVLCVVLCRSCLGQSRAGRVSWAPRSGGHVLSLSHTVHL